MIRHGVRLALALTLVVVDSVLFGAPAHARPSDGSNLTSARTIPSKLVKLTGTRR